MKQRLLQGAAAMGIDLDDLALERFETLYHMLTETNKHMNLTAVTEENEVCDRHFLDSLAPVSLGLLPEGAKLVDVGTGAGFPGLPLLIARPDLSLTMMDSLNKRLSFIQSVLDALGLSASLVHARAEDMGRDPIHRAGYDFALSRAVAPLPVLLEYTVPLLKLGGKSICWKGPEPEDASSAARKLGTELEPAIAYSVPGRDWAHRLVIGKKTIPTAPAFPRKAGTPAKKPL